MVAEYTIRLPTRIHVTKTVVKPLNLNTYRNLHHYSLNTQKQNFHDEVKALLGPLPKANKIWIHYQIFAPTNGTLDTMNVGSIVDKYFSDTLVKAKVIPDDNYKHVVFNSFSFGGVQRLDGHAIATVFILEEEKPMRLILDQDDIQTALEDYVTKMSFPNATGVELSIDGDEIVAEVTMGSSETNTAKPPRAKTNGKRRGRPRNADKEVTNAPTETASEGGDDSSDSGESKPTETTSEDSEGSSDKTTSEKKNTGNLFGDEENQSSASSETNSDGEKTPDNKPQVKRTSIFDAD